MNNNSEKIGLYSQLFADDEVYFLKDKVALKKLCIVLDEALNQKNELFLNKILTAIGESLISSSILSLDHVDNIEVLATEKIIVFGLDRNELYNVEVLGNKKILYADSLNILSSDKDLKTKLWGTLQEMFLGQ